MSSVYFHYTDKKSARKIKKSKVILESGNDGNDAAFGNGVYLTKIKPSNPKEAIARNNFDGCVYFVEKKLKEGKVDAVIAVEIPDDDSDLHKEDAKGRDVYRYDGDLDLTDKKFRVFIV